MHQESEAARGSRDRFTQRGASSYLSLLSIFRCCGLFNRSNLLCRGTRDVPGIISAVSMHEICGTSDTGMTAESAPRTELCVGMYVTQVPAIPLSNLRSMLWVALSRDGASSCGATTV